jgi:hypothetical protein
VVDESIAADIPVRTQAERPNGMTDREVRIATMVHAESKELNLPSRNIAQRNVERRFAIHNFENLAPDIVGKTVVRGDSGAPARWGLRKVFRTGGANRAPLTSRSRRGERGCVDDAIGGEASADLREAARGIRDTLGIEGHDVINAIIQAKLNRSRRA